MTRTVLFFIAIILIIPPPAYAKIRVESRLPESAETRELAERLKNVLADTVKRIHQIFGIVPDVVAVVDRSESPFDFRITGRERGVDILVINAGTIRDYPDEEMRIAAARGLFAAIWPKYRKPYLPDSRLKEKMYLEGMTCYAAELLFPGSARWKYAGRPGDGGAELYRQYREAEKEIAGEVLAALQTGAERALQDRFFGQDAAGSSPRPGTSGRLLSCRLMKSFEQVMDPKMIQLMDFDEFKDRLPGRLEVLKSGYGLK